MNLCLRNQKALFPCLGSANAREGGDARRGGYKEERVNRRRGGVDVRREGHEGFCRSPAGMGA